MGKKKKKVSISPEKMAIIVEKGLRAVRLTDEGKEYLVQEGMKELYVVKESVSNPAPPLESEVIETAIKKYFSKTEKSLIDIIDILWVKLKENAIEIIRELSSWQIVSPAYAYRGVKEKKSVSYSKEIGKITVTLEVIQQDSRCADIIVRLTDVSKRDKSHFQVQLFRDKRCLETINTGDKNVASLSAVKIGNYTLKLSDEKGEITSFSLRMEQ